LTQTAAWGLGALQTLTFKERFEELPDAEKRLLRDLPGRVFYGVDSSEEAVALRLLGVPRTAAEPLARSLGVEEGLAPAQIRQGLHAAGAESWVEAMGEIGTSYRKVWTIIEGLG